jgi:hypothetical protein
MHGASTGHFRNQLSASLIMQLSHDSHAEYQFTFRSHYAKIDLIDYLGDTNMTREEFDQHFAATQDTTEGFTDGQLDALNDDVWEEIRMLEMDEEVTAEHAKTVMNRIMNSWPHDGSVRT